MSLVCHLIIFYQGEDLKACDNTQNAEYVMPDMAGYIIKHHTWIQALGKSSLKEEETRNPDTHRTVQ
jgi:hypothetical protein